MGFDARTTALIYEQLVPLVGEGDANRLVAQLSRLLEDRFVTKEQLRAELAELRLELITSSEAPPLRA